MPKPTIRPILISADDTGGFRITVREIRFNSQHYPLVTSNLQDEVFPTVRAARIFARDNFGAEAKEVALA